jgi:hypothetical protein
MIDQRSSSLEAEEARAEKTNASWQDLFRGGVLGASFGFFSYGMNLPGPLALGSTVVVEQLLHLIIPAKKREYRSFGQWVLRTIIYSSATILVAYLVVYVVNWFSALGID